MRVCLDARKLWDSGIGTYIRGLLAGFPEVSADIQFDLIVRKGDSFPDVMTSTPFRCFSSGSKEYSIGELFTISRIANNTSADLLHAPHYVVPLRLKMPLVVTVHDVIHLRFPEYFAAYQRIYARWMLQRACSISEVILTVSECTKQDLIRMFGVDADKITVGYSGVDQRFFQSIPREQADRFRSDCGLPSGYLLYVGNMKPHKNVSGLIHAWACLSDAVRPPLVIVGEGADYRALLRRQVESLGRSNEVFFRGNLPEEAMVCLYKSARAYVQPSRYEGFGSPPLEAMACGIPVTVSNRGALPEIAGPAALVFDPDNSDEFTVSLEKIITDQTIRQSLVEKGHRRAQEFTWTRTARLVYESYQRAMTISHFEQK